MVAACALLGACSSNDTIDSGSVAPTQQVVTSTTTAPSTLSPSTTSAPVTTTAPSTTSTAPTTTEVPTTTVATTTTIPPGTELVISKNGIGTANFGADATAVIQYVTSILGPPTADSGSVDTSNFGTCPGTSVRAVTWSDLVLFFGDDSAESTGNEHFIAFTLGPPLSGAIRPAGMATDANIAVGTGYPELVATYPQANVSEPNAAGEFEFEIDDDLVFRTNGVDIDSVVVAVRAGNGCQPLVG